MSAEPPGTLSGRTFIFSLAGAVVVLATLWTLREPIYFTNDDVALRLEIAGQDLPDEPATTHLIFVHEALARMLVAIQPFLPRLSIWSLVVAATLVLGITALVAFVWTSYRSSDLGRAIALIGMVAAIIPLATGLQFTIGPVLCGGVAVLIAAFELFWRLRPRLWVLGGSAFLLIAGYLVRPLGAEAGAVVTLAGSILVAASAPAWRTRLVKCAGVAGVLLVSFLVLDRLDRALYQTSGSAAQYDFAGSASRS